MRKIFFIVLFFLSDILFASVSKTAGDKKGYLVNMNNNGINNIQYSCRDHKNITHQGSTGKYLDNSTEVLEDGVFLFKVGCLLIKFSLQSADQNHEIILAEVTTSELDNSDYKLTFTELAGTQRTNTSNLKARNIARLLLSLDSDNNPKNNIDINTSDINNSYDFTSGTVHIEDLNNTIKAQYPTQNKYLTSELCAVVHMERALRSRGYDTDTVPPCMPQLAYDLNATSNNQTFIELIGEENTNIYLNGIDTGYDLDENGNFAEFELSTPIELNSFDQFNFSLVDATGKQSAINEVKLFNDPDQPHFNNLPLTLNLNANPTLDLNVSDTSKDHNLSDFPKLSLQYEVLDNNVSGHKNNFTINENGILSAVGSIGAGTYYIKIKVTDEVLHYVEANLTIIKP
jgi:hypothetical protein